MNFQTHAHPEDARFSFALVAPDTAAEGLVVLVHDSERNYRLLLEAFGDWAAAQHLAMLAPIFPPDVLGDGNADGYKLLHEGPVRHAALLNGMVACAAGRLGCAPGPFFIHGYSGGAQFVHRYTQLYPACVAAASIAAPGEVTLPDEDIGWWGGVADAAELFGHRPDWQRLGEVPIALAVGSRDVGTELLSTQPASRFWAGDHERLGSTRQVRLRLLQRAWAEVGVAAALTLLPGADHASGQRPAVDVAVRHFAANRARLPPR